MRRTDRNMRLALSPSLIWPHRPRRSHRPRFLDFAAPKTMSLYVHAWHGCAVVGADQVPARGPVLVVANHPHHADPAFLTAACGRWVHFLQARECHEVFLLRRLFRWFGCIPVGGSARDRRAIQAALKCLREGAAVGIFPEGHLTSERPKRPDRPKTGAAWLALRSRAPVIPARIMHAPSAGGILSDWFCPSSGVCVVFGPAIDLSRYYGRRATHACLREVTDLFMQQISVLEATAGPCSKPLSAPSARPAVLRGKSRQCSRDTVCANSPG
jgi:1-acyl-sn-glycerol-3-phosphate acyltransferase